MAASLAAAGCGVEPASQGSEELPDRSTSSVAASPEDLACDVAETLVDDLYASVEQAGFIVTAPPELLPAVEEALQQVAVRQEVEIPLPDAPEEGPLAAFASDVEQREGARAIWFDMPDADAYRESEVMETLVAILFDELNRAGVSGCGVVAYEAL
jgi:hypothetical protein